MTITRQQPIYLSLADQLRRSIRDGHLGTGNFIGTESALVRTHRVSRVSVRKATDVLIADGLIERRPGKGLYVRCAEPALRTTTPAIQAVCGNLAWPACLMTARGVQAAAREGGSTVQLYDAHGSLADDVEYLRRLPDGDAVGAIILALESPVFTEALYALKVRGFPFVVIDPHSRDLDVPAVSSDNIAGGRLAGAHLIAHGHRRIAFIGNLGSATVQDRLTGLRDAIGDAGLPFDRTLVIDIQPDDPLADWGRITAERTIRLIGQPAPPTAIFASCDAIARGVVAAIRSAGLAVPADISVIGFDDDPLAQQIDPPLTTVRQDFEAMGRAAIELLGRRIAGTAATAERRILPVALAERSSVAAPPAQGG